ncbi:MAG: hypothetical protein FGM24_07655 [Candidatus Kapabacteria bacterium]|nr:hypothetical protein [Candidatus Kapabacteria bacterium]
MRSIIALLAISLVVMSCSKNDPVAPAESVITVPGIGSSYTFSTYEIDENGAPVPGTEGQQVYSVAATGLVNMGKTGVWAVVSQAGDTLYFSADNKNDVWFRPSSGTDGPTLPWMRLPVTTGTPGRDSVTGTTEINGNSVDMTTTAATKRIGQDTVMIGTSSVKTQNIQIDLSIKYSAFGMEQTVTITTFMFYAPKLGFYAGLASPPQNVGGKQSEGTGEELQSFSIK